MGWELADIGWFCESCYGVVASEGDFSVSVFKQVGDFAYVCGEVKVKVAHFVLFPAFVGGVACSILCCIWCFSLWSRVVGNLFFTMWRMVCHSLCSRSLLRWRLNTLSM